MEELENGCLWLWEQSTDYLLCDGFEDSLPNLYQQDDIIFEYNQSRQEWSKKSCTIFSAVGAISDLFNYEFSLDEIKEIDERSYSLWRIRNQWWWVQSAVKLVADRWNANEKLVKKYWKVAYYRIYLYWDRTLDAVLDKWYTVMTNINWNGKYQMDYLKDDILNGTEFGSATYGHALSLRKVDWKLCVKDNYKGRMCNDGKTDCNIFELEHYPREISVFWSNWYVYTKVAEDALEEIKRLNTLKSKVIQVASLNSEIWHLVNDENYQNSLHKMNIENRKKLNDIEEQLQRY